MLTSGFRRYIDSWNRHFPCFLYQIKALDAFNMHFILAVHWNYLLLSCRKWSWHTKAISVCLFNIFCNYITNEIFDTSIKDHGFKVELKEWCNFCAISRLQYFFVKMTKLQHQKYIFHWYERKFFIRDSHAISFHCRLERQKAYWFQTLVGVGLC